MVPSLLTAIETLLEDPADIILARSILRSDNPVAIARQVESFTRAHLGRQIVDCPLFTQSVGAVFGVELDDGSRVVIKIHRESDLDAVYAAQAELHDAGFLCARVILPPRQFNDGVAAVMSYLEAQPPADPTAPTSVART